MALSLHLGKPVIPREHGVWMVVIVSITTGSFAFRPDGRTDWFGFFLLTITVLSGFMASAPLRRILAPGSAVGRDRLAAWFFIYSGIASVCFLSLASKLDGYGIFWFAIPALLLSALYLKWIVAKTQRTLFAETAGIIGLAASAPAASYIQQGGFTTESVILYFLLMIWFLDRMITTRKVLDSIRSGAQLNSPGMKTRWMSTQFTIHFICLTLAGVIIFLSGGLAPWTAFLPFLLATAKNTAYIFTLKKVNDPMKIGFAEMRLSLAFAMFMIVVWRVAVG